MRQDQLISFCPTAAPFYDALCDAFQRFEISTVARQAAFLAEAAHESQGFAHVEENLNYSAARLIALWPGKFPAAEVDSFAHQPIAIANRLYAGLEGNGDEVSGDGWKFRGRGLFQLTGRFNYAKESVAIYSDRRLLIDPDFVSRPGAACLTAGEYWARTSCNALADANDFAGITRAINGKRMLGEEQREAWWKEAQRALSMGAP